MLISDIQRKLEWLRHERGDVEVFRALHEYGCEPFTEASLADFIRIETTTTREGSKIEQLVMGTHR